MQSQGAANGCYAELHCLSNFSFLRGASHPRELVGTAAGLGYAGLALTDECSVAGVVRAHSAAKELPLKLVVGSELTTQDGLKVVVLADSRRAYAALCDLISRARRAAPKGEYCVSRGDIADCLQSHGLLLWLPSYSEQAAEAETGRWLQDRFASRLWLAVELLNAGNDRRRLRGARALGRELGAPLVATGNVHMHCRERRMLQDTLTAIRRKVPLDALGFELHSNAERCLRPIGELVRRYPAELLRESLAILERVDFSLKELRYEYPSELIPEGQTAASHLRALTERGCRWRWPTGESAKVRGLIEHELALIAELRYEALFPDRLRHRVRSPPARHLVPRQRLGCNSVVCFCLGITEVDPDRMQTLMERFISKRAQRATGHRRGFRARAARGGHSIHLPQVFARAGGARGDGHYLSRPQRHSRCRQSARRRGAQSQRARAVAAMVGERCRRRATHQRGRARPQEPESPALDRARRIAARVFRAISRSTSAVSWSRSGRSTSSCRSRTPRCRSAPSSNGIRTISRSSA